MIPQQLIHRLDLVQLLLQRRPIHLQNSTHSKPIHTLNKRKHPRSQSKHSSFPHFQLGVIRSFSPTGSFGVFGPGFREDAFGVFELKEMTEEELVTEDGFP